MAEVVPGARVHARRRTHCLDEPTSSLDPDAESEVLDRFLDLSRRTTVFVTHRLSSARTAADLIYVFSNGAVVERGTHPELIDTNRVVPRAVDRCAVIFDSW